MGYRECPYCGASLDPGEICDCRKENAAPGGNDTEGQQAKKDRYHDITGGTENQ